MNGRIANHPALPDLVAPGFELGFDERHEPCPLLCKCKRAFEYLGEPDEASVANNQVHRFRDVICGQDTCAGLFENDHPVILAKLPRELVRSAIDCIDATRTAREENVCKSAG